jgi:hypothetical protein
LSDVLATQFHEVRASSVQGKSECQSLLRSDWPALLKLGDVGLVPGSIPQRPLCWGLDLGGRVFVAEHEAKEAAECDQEISGATRMD